MGNYSQVIETISPPSQLGDLGPIHVSQPKPRASFIQLPQDISICE